jgi:hypothetical protein
MGMSSKACVLLGAALLAGIALRAWDALGSSLWLDELHTLAHASPATASGVFEHVHWDFHAPAFFLFVHWIWTPGTRPELARAVPILASLAVLVPLIAFARRSRLGSSAPAVAGALFLLSPFQILYATELRPYAWLMLASAIACWAAFTGGRRAARFALFAAAVGFGLLTHYLMAFVVLLIGLVRLLFAIPPLRWRGAAGEKPLALGWLILAGAVGACAFLPWLFTYMSWAIETPGELAPDTAQRTLTSENRADILQAPIKLLVPQVRSLGTPWSGFAAAGAVALIAGIAGAVVAWLLRAIRRELLPVDRAIAMAFTFAGIALLLVPGMSVVSWARVSIRYLCVAAWLLPVVCCELLAAVRRRGLRRALGALMIGGALVAGIGQAGGKTREDVRGATEAARLAGADLLAADASRPPLYTALLSQPPRFEHGTPYLAYANDLDHAELKLPAHAGPRPPLVPARGEPGFDRPVVVITRRHLDLDTPEALDRAIRHGMAEIQRLRVGRKMVRRVPVDETMAVWVFSPESP